MDLIADRLRLLLTETSVYRINRKYSTKLNFIPQGGAQLYISGDLSKFHIDPSSHLKSSTYIETSGGVSIGKNVHIGRGLTIYSVSHRFHDSKKLPYDDEIILAPVTISDFVWIGANVTILGGVEIGEGAIIGANSTVVKDVEPLSIYGGAPAVKIGKRDEEYYFEARDNHHD